MRATLFIVGAFFELAGILLVASPDLVPYANRLTDSVLIKIAIRFDGFPGPLILLQPLLSRRSRSVLRDYQTSQNMSAAEAVDQAQGEYRALRLIGVVALVVGLGCVTVANFV